MSEETITILTHTFPRKLFDEGLYITINALHINDDPSFEKKFLGMVFRKRMLSMDTEEYYFTHKNDEITGFVCYMDEESVTDDICQYFTRALIDLKPHKCDCCAVEHYVTTDKEHNCQLCIDALVDMDVTNTKIEDTCYICQEPLTDNIGAFPCSIHHGHIPCISNFHRHRTNRNQVCPIRCAKQEITIDITAEFIESFTGDFLINPDSNLALSEHQQDDA